MEPEQDSPLVSLQSTTRILRGGEWRLASLHDRPDYLVIWATKGQALALLNGKRFGIGAHTALLIPAGTLFALDLGRTGAGLVLTIAPKLAAEMQLPDQPRLLRLYDVQLQKEMTGHLDAIQSEAQSNALYAQDACRAHCALLAVSLRRNLAKLPDLPKPNGSERVVEAFCALVQSHFHTGQSMADYARMMGVTPTHLARCCKQCCGMTAADILTARSLYAARDRIEASRAPYNQIAEELGFGSAAYFSRFIQTHTGKSPSTLRQQASTQRSAF